MPAENMFITVKKGVKSQNQMCYQHSLPRRPAVAVQARLADLEAQVASERSARLAAEQHLSEIKSTP